MREPSWSIPSVALHVGDCLDVLKEMPDASVDAVITDPPYGLTDLTTPRVLEAIAAWMSGDRDHVPDARGFMGRAWDAFVPPPGVWDECLRVLKPGGHLVAFAGTRTWDLMGLSIRIAGFELRDTVADLMGADAPGLIWAHGQGFPKSLDVSKAIDKAARRDYVLAAVALGLDVPGNSLHDWTKAEHSPGDAWWERFKAHLSPEEWTRVERAVVGQRASGATAGMQQLGPSGIKGGTYDVTVPATPDAARWSGWGTALKPGWEPIILARKPLAGTVAATVLEHGTGALNIGACRVEPTGESRPRVGEASQETRYTGRGGTDFAPLPGVRGGAPEGRWPTNLVFTHSVSCVEGYACDAGCSVAELDRQSGNRVSGKMRAGTSRANRGGWSGPMPAETGGETYGDSGGASRFFPVFRQPFRYEAKAPASERPKLPDGTAWPTVKPLDLMRWLVRLITPPGGTVLDPFAGTGTTGEAAIVEGFRSVLIERDPAAVELIKTRFAKPIAPTLDLFGEETSHA